MVLYDLMEDDTALFSIIVEYLLYNRRIGQRNSWRAAETDESAAADELDDIQDEEDYWEEA